MKLIVGLGNPGKEYENTRHNIGFFMVDSYLGNVDWKEKFNGLYYQTVIFSEKVIFLKPCMYINLSGEVIRKYVDYFKIDISDIFIIHDDLDLDTGMYRLRATGRSAGHNGLKNIEKCLGTQEYKRLKIGIGNSDIDTKDYVLSNFSKKDKELIDNEFEELNKILDEYFNLDFSKIMALYNKKNV